MTDKKITQLPAGTALAGNELLEAVQNGNSVSIPTSYFPPIGAAYLTTANNGALSGSRTLVLGSGLAAVDGGPGSTFTLMATGSGLVPQYTTSSPAAGTYNDVVLPGNSDIILDVNTAAGNVSYTGFVAQRDGQKLTVSNTGGNLLAFLALSGSLSANQLRIPSELDLVQNQTITFQYSSGAGKWLAV